MAKKITYTDAYNELQEILNELQQEEVTIDKLPVKLERVHQLLEICKAKLHETEENYQQIISKISK